MISRKIILIFGQSTSHNQFKFRQTHIITHRHAQTHTYTLNYNDVLVSLLWGSLRLFVTSFPVANNDIKIFYFYVLLLKCLIYQQALVLFYLLIDNPHYFQSVRLSWAKPHLRHRRNSECVRAARYQVSLDSKLVKKMKNLNNLQLLRLNTCNNVSIKKKITLLDQIQASEYSFKHTIQRFQAFIKPERFFRLLSTRMFVCPCHRLCVCVCVCACVSVRLCVSRRGKSRDSTKQTVRVLYGVLK